MTKEEALNKLAECQIIGTYDARATVDMIAEDLLAAPNFTGAHA